MSQGKVSPFTVSQLLLPFVKYLAVLEDHREINHIKQNVFRYLMRQSDKGIEFEKRYAAWRKVVLRTDAFFEIKVQFLDQICWWNDKFGNKTIRSSRRTHSRLGRSRKRGRAVGSQGGERERRASPIEIQRKRHRSDVGRA